MALVAHVDQVHVMHRIAVRHEATVGHVTLRFHVSIVARHAEAPGQVLKVGLVGRRGAVAAVGEDVAVKGVEEEDVVVLGRRVPFNNQALGRVGPDEAT